MAEKKRKSQQSSEGEGTHYSIERFFKKSRTSSPSGADLDTPVKDQDKSIVEEASKKEVASLLSGDGVTVDGEVGLGNQPTQSPDRQNAIWLRSLTLAESKILYDVCVSRLQLVSKPRVSESDLEVLKRLRRGASTSGRDGAWYIAWSTCRVVATNDKSTSHPRAQVKLDTLGANSLGQQLQARLGARAWETLKQYTSVLKVQYHAIAYNALPIREVSPVPLNCGAGGSISHPCDQRGCLVHLEATPVHKDNMDRQRCRGVLLMYFRNVIVAEYPCGHGKEQGLALAGDLEVQIKRSCINISMVEITERIFGEIKNMN